MKDNNVSNNAITVYRSMCNSIYLIINAANIHSEHLIAKAENRNVDNSVIDILIKGGMTGDLMNSGWLSETTKEQIKPKVKPIVNSVIVSSYTALEVYFRNKFEELLELRLNTDNNNLITQVVSNLNFQGLSRIKRNFKDILDIHLELYKGYKLIDSVDPFFESKDLWKIIEEIASARNEIVHRGDSIGFGANGLADAWGVFDFSRQWVESFDANFNMYFYDGFKTDLFFEYEEQLKTKQHQQQNQKKRNNTTNSSRS